MPIILSTLASLILMLVLLAGPSHNAQAQISFGLGSDFIDVPFDFETTARNYVTQELGFPGERIDNIQLIAIRRGRVEDIITRVQAVVRFDGPVVNAAGEQGPGAIVVVMRRSGSVVSHFEQR